MTLSTVFVVPNCALVCGQRVGFGKSSGLWKCLISINVGWCVKYVPFFVVYA